MLTRDIHEASIHEGFGLPRVSVEERGGKEGGEDSALRVMENNDYHNNHRQALLLTWLLWNGRVPSVLSRDMNLFGYPIC